ncbi:sugar ABC transporter permease [Arthrobacter sp. NamB2]|uniref:carbohydrate ABC transporter permease n=1 Tax=Arthrobacter sp. NamB2 TaxID=2576035 RepID=UPI0010CA0B03|nr:sugar ABC transporter permease [Arthrobacter sp. NamB2]TKV27306.1 sugar ABC transporter permease [Arthrobacter sp. NamB2]
MSQLVEKPPAAGSEPGTPQGPAPAARRKRKSPFAYILIAPAVIMELLIHIVPMILGVWIAFLGLTQLNIRNWLRAPFVGFDNFVAGLDPNGPIGGEFLASFGRTLVFTVIVLAIVWVLGIMAAVLLHSSFRGNGFLRTFFLIPYALPSYVATIAWAFMFSQRDGAINKILVDDLGLLDERPFWLLGGNAFWVTVIVTAWQMWPFAFLMLLAALQNIPKDVYEAAAIDGASLWKQFVLITLPMIRPANGVLLLVMSLWIFNQFNVPFVLFGAAPPESARLVSPLIYQHSFSNWNFGLGGAMSVLLLILLFIASVVYVRMVLPKGKDID